jgi:hypothetical protein
MSEPIKMPVLRMYDCGCTSGHDSLIRLWVKVDFTREDLEHLKSLWNLMIRQFEREVEKSEKSTNEPAEVGQ